MAKNTSALETIRALMARAEHPNTPPPEAELALRQANRMMARHAIDEAQARASMSEAERRAPVQEVWTWMSGHSEYHPYLRSMLEAIAANNRCMAVIASSYRDAEVTMVGFREDVDWVQMLYTSCQLTFLSKLSPTWNKELGIDANVYAFKVAGHSWNSIWGLMATHHFGIDDDRLHEEYTPYADRGRLYTGRIRREGGGYYDRGDWREFGLPCGPRSPSNKYLLRAYRRHAKLIGDENPIETQRLDAYRRSFAKGFSEQIEYRLRRMKADADEEVAASGQEVALRDAFADVREAFYREFPDLHPEEVRRKQMVRARESRESARREREADDALLAAMTPAARARILERRARKEARERQSNERWWKEYDRRNQGDHSGATLGRQAAESVNLTRATPVKDEFHHRGKLGS